MAKTIDTLHAASALIDAGVAKEQAEAIVNVISKTEDNLITKADLDAALANLKSNLIMWIVGLEVATTALVVSLIL